MPLESFLRGKWIYSEKVMRTLLLDQQKARCDDGEGNGPSRAEIEDEISRIEQELFDRLKKARQWMKYLELNGVDGRFREQAQERLAELRQSSAATTEPEEKDMDRKAEPIRIFISYSHKDVTLKTDLETNLSVLRRRELIDNWSDSQLEPGVEWEKEIYEKLQSADVILLLISIDFIASEFCYGKEMKRALDRHKKGEAVVIPIILRECNWHGTPFAKLQALPAEAKAVTLWSDRDAAWTDISKRIERVVEGMRRTRRP